MSDNKRSFVTLGADVGGKDAHQATNTHILALRRLLADSCPGPYSKSVRELALVLRVDGSVYASNRADIDGVSLEDKNTYATADLFVPKEAWASDDPRNLRRFLASQVENAVREVIRLIQARGIEFAGNVLKDDVSKAIERFLSD